MLVYLAGRYVLQRYLSPPSQQRVGRLLALAGCGGLALLLGTLTFARNQDYHSSLSIWDDACRKQPDNLRALINRGIGYGRTGRLDLAIEDFDRVIAHDPQREFAFYNRALAYQRQGKLDRAISDFSQAIVLDPRMSQAYNGRGLLLAKKGAVDAALKDFEQGD